VDLFKKTEQVKRQAEVRARLLEAQAARAEAEAGQRRMAFLAEASRVLSSSLEAEVSLQSLARLIVASLADACIVDLLEEDGSIRRIAVEGAGLTPLTPSTSTDGAPAHLTRRPHDPPAPTGVLRVLRSGQPWLAESLDGADLAVAAGETEDLASLRSVGPQSCMIVPVVARERTLGALSLFTASVARRYGEADLTLALDLAQRAALAVDNARLYAEARAAVRVRDEFLSSATHDMKTPLAVIRGQAQLLQRRMARTPTADSERLAGMLQRIHGATTKMVGLIDQMLDVAHLQMGKPIELNCTPIDLVALARDVVTEQSAPVRASHSLRLETSHERLVGLWDAARLERVLGNLISNAVKYSPDGGDVTVEVVSETDQDVDWAVMRVQDRGVGIPADELHQVFERFHRGRNVVGKIAGTGIGLAGVRQIVEEHGGSCSVQSQEGRGATFTVRLPLRRDAALRKAAPAKR
jgi:signal transduction histidine kinase